MLSTVGILDTIANFLTLEFFVNEAPKGDDLASLSCRSRHGEVGSSRSISAISARADIDFRQLA